MLAQFVGMDVGKINVLSPAWSMIMSADNVGMGGAGVAREGLSLSALVNPAGVKAQSLTIAVGGWWRPSAPGLFGFSYTQATFLPSNVSVTVPTEPFFVQVGIARTHDEKYSSSEIGITTEESPDTPIGYTRYISSGSVHTAYASLSAPIGDIAFVGLTAGVDHADFWTTYHTIWYHKIGTGWRLTAGGLFALTSGITCGATLKVVESIELASRDNVPPPLYPGRTPVGVSASSVARSPLEIEIGTALRLSPRMCLMLSTQYEQWEKVFTDAQNQWQFRMGIEAQVADPMMLRVGTFTHKEPMAERRDYFDQQFLTLGLRLNLAGRAQLDLAYYTSSPFTRTQIDFGTMTFDRSFHRSELVGGISVVL